MMPGGAVGRRGDDPAAGGVLLVDRQRVEGDPVHHAQRVGRRASLGSRRRRGAGAAARRRTLQAAGQHARRCRMPRSTHSCITAQMCSSPARTSSSVRQASSLASMTLADRQPRLAAAAPAARRRCGTGTAPGSRPARRGRRRASLVDDEPAADRVVGALGRSVGAVGVERGEAHAVGVERAASLAPVQHDVVVASKATSCVPSSRSRPASPHAGDARSSAVRVDRLRLLARAGRAPRP